MSASDIAVQCPCCGARLQIDTALGRVVAHEAPPRQRGAAPDLDRAGQILQEQAARREELFKQSTEDEKVKSDVLDRKFREALRKSKDEPVERPLRDIDF